MRNLGNIPNREHSVTKLLGKLGPKGAWTACCEAGPTGYALYWQLTRLGCSCEVVAPTLIPVKAGDLTAVRVPDESHEALRDLVRAREAAKADQLRARHPLSKYLSRHGRRPTVKMKPWSQRYLDWIRREVKLDQYGFCAN